MKHAQEALLAQSLSTLIERAIRLALDEDVGPGDATSEALLPEGATAKAAFVARQSLVTCGAEVAAQVFRTVDKRLKMTEPVADGSRVAPGAVLLRVEGPARSLFTAERTALNLMQRMCAVATLTKQYVDAVAGTGVTILDTRKTMPGLRVLDKIATRAGGAQNHRMGLYDRILIKDNHIAVLGSVAAAVAAARKHGPKGIHVEVECDTLAQVAEALAAGPDSILLDNMSLDELRQAVAMTARKLPLEASGNVTLDTVRTIAETGVDFISVGRITHSAVSVDIGLDVDL